MSQLLETNHALFREMQQKTKGIFTSAAFTKWINAPGNSGKLKKHTFYIRGGQLRTFQLQLHLTLLEFSKFHLQLLLAPLRLSKFPLQLQLQFYFSNSNSAPTPLHFC